MNIRRFTRQHFGKEWPYRDWFTRWERGKKGYARSDLWNLDSYMMIVLGDALKTLAEVGHGFPVEYDKNGNPWTFESWCDELRRVAKLCDDYEEWLWELDPDKESPQIEIFDWLKENYGSLWD